MFRVQHTLRTLRALRLSHPLRRRAFTAMLVGAMVMTVLVSALVFTARPAHAAKPDIDPTYANGQTVYMIGPHLMTNPSANLLAHADELYLLSFPVDTSCAPNCGPITLPSGYQPQCNPCFHPGLPTPFVYHDHVVTGAPGAGNDGTAGEFKGPWVIIVLVYNPDFAFISSFSPVTSDEALDIAEGAGEFLPINPQGANHFEINTGNVLICPLVSSHA